MERARRKSAKTEMGRLESDGSWDFGLIGMGREIWAFGRENNTSLADVILTGARGVKISAS